LSGAPALCAENCFENVHTDLHRGGSVVGRWRLATIEKSRLCRSARRTAVTWEWQPSFRNPRPHRNRP